MFDCFTVDPGVSFALACRKPTNYPGPSTAPRMLRQPEADDHKGAVSGFSDLPPG